jgi:hypothetical protein
MKNITKPVLACPIDTYWSKFFFAQWWHPVASSEALDLLHQAMCAVLYRRIAMAIKTVSFVGVLFDCCFVDCLPGGRWDNTEQVVARCWRPVASGVILDMLYWAMPSVLLRRTSVVVETAGGQGHLFGITNFVINNNCS